MERKPFFICQRPAHKTRGLLWEFVGGKVEPGETKEQALIRECQEELGVTVEVEDIFMELIHTYPDFDRPFNFIPRQNRIRYAAAARA
ncbi:MAG: NUDIX domain-containing protein [Oscillospiraceae bacterium]